MVGRNFAYQNMTTIKAIFDKDTYTNPFIGAGGNGVGVDDFNADNFDHGAAGFVGGSPFWVNQAGTKPISGFPVPPGHPGVGQQVESGGGRHLHPSPVDGCPRRAPVLSAELPRS